MLHYFAYGSNLPTARLQARVPSARPLCVGRLARHVLEFSKRSFMDHSAKCTIVHTGDPRDEVWGVLFTMDEEQRPDLDRAEGLGHGYERREVEVLTDRGAALVFTYIVQPSHHDPGLVPFDWYRALVLAGAVEHGLPGEYIDRIREVADEPDPDQERAARMWALARSL